MEKKHKRFIRCTQQVTYHKEVELNDEELAILEKEDGGLGISIHNTEPYQIIELLLDPSDICDTDQEYNDFELLKS